MKVAFDTGPLTSDHAVRGIGVHTNELFSALLQEVKSRKNLEIEAFDFKAESKKLNARKYDLVHYTSFHPHFFSLPLVKPARKVIVTIHDLIRLIYPKAYPPGFKGDVRLFINKLLVRNIDAVITISETSKKDIIRFLPVKEDKVFVIYLAPKRLFRKIENGEWKKQIAKQYGLPNQFVLYVGDVNYNKNLLTLGKACEIAKIPLVMVGKRTIPKGIDFTHPENKPFGNFLSKYGDNKNIIRLGFVEDVDLVKIWNLATVYCQPSIYEGFGLTVLESMACGVPVVASDIKVHREIAAGSVLFFDPKNPNDMAEKIKKIIINESLRGSLLEKGFLNVGRYSWRKTARETLNVYEKVLAQD